MVNITRQRRNSMGGSPKAAAEVGEIDTKAPFASVRAALSLFGSTTSSANNPKPAVTKKPAKSQTEVQEVLDKEAQFHLTLNELNKLKEQLRGAESARAESLPELDKAKRTLEELRQKIKLVNESKQSIVEQVVLDSEKQESDAKREEYRAAIVELDAAKQQLNNMRREFDAASEAKLRCFRKSQQAELAADAHRERIKELSKQISAMQEALAKLKVSSNQVVQEHEKFLAKKDEQLQSCKVAKEDAEMKILSLKGEHHSLLDDSLAVKLAETDAQIASLQTEVKIARSAFLDAQKATSFELEISKGSLIEVEEEKKSFENSMESLKRELQKVGNELSEQKRKHEEIENLANKIKEEIEDKKNELEAGLVNKTSAATASDDMASSLEQLAIQTRIAKQEAEEMKKRIDEQLQLAESSRELTKEMENKMPEILKQVEEAKALETIAQEKIKAMSQKATESNETGNGKIKLSNEEYNALMEKVNDSDKLADIKVAAALAHVEALVGNQQEAAKKYEAYSKAIEELKTAEEDALKTAEMAEAATNALEAELQRIHHQEEISKIAQPN